MATNPEGKKKCLLSTHLRTNLIKLFKLPRNIQNLMSNAILTHSFTENCFPIELSKHLGECLIISKNGFKDGENPPITVRQLSR